LGGSSCKMMESLFAPLDLKQRGYQSRMRYWNGGTLVVVNIVISLEKYVGLQWSRIRVL
jgi:hypothetical protein